MQNKITTIELNRTIGMLKSQVDFISAIDLAKKLGVCGSHELKRRHVRRIIKQLRDGGHWIVATLAGGYFLTKDELLWKNYLEGRNIDAKRIIGEAAHRKFIATRSGQGMLFDSRVHVGCAMGGVGK